MNAGNQLAVATLFAAMALLADGTSVMAQETVSIGTAKAALLRPDTPRGSVILMPGGNGDIDVGENGKISKQLINNQLVRTRYDYLKEGLAVLVIDANTNLSRAIDFMAAIKRPVVVIATSRGTLRAARGLVLGARPDALVLTSGFLTKKSGDNENVETILQTPNILPPTLVIHHRRDGCHWTSPKGVEPFAQWAGGRVHVEWLDGGISMGDACRAKSYHGFNGLDKEVVTLAAHFP
jgi:hypothetical protein